MLLALAAGGALGAVARYLLAVRLYGELGIAFPWGTLAVNVLGCALAGGARWYGQRRQVEKSSSALTF